MTALSFPLPFTAALLAGLLAAVMIRDSASSPRARLLFAVFYAAVALLWTLHGLRWGYHLRASLLLLPMVVLTVGPLSYLAFQALTAAAWPGWRAVLLRHFWPLPLMALLLWRGRPLLLVDLAIIASFLTYAWLLSRIRALGPDGLVNSRLGDGAVAIRVLTSFMWMHVLSAVLEVAMLAALLSGAADLAAALFAGFTLVLIGVLGWGLLGYATAQAPPMAATPPPPDPPTDADETLLASLEALLAGQKLYADPALTLARLARRLGVPARAVSQAVNRARGMNVSQFINNFRVAEAQRLLRQTDQPVTDIMLAAGFQTKSNFNREFRRVTGDSPSGWRARQAA